METELIAAKLKYDQARERQANEERRKTITRLRSVRAELKDMRKQFDELTAEIARADAELERWRRHNDVILTQLADCERRKPLVADFLPDDPEVIAWRSQYDALRAAHAEHLALRLQMLNPEVPRQTAFDLREKLIAAAFAEQNLVNALNGTLPSLASGPHGGVFAPGS